MVTEEFNLSEEIIESENVINTITLNNIEFIPVAYVRRFIEEIRNKLEGRINYSTTMGNKMFMEEINKLAGERLISQKED